MEHSIQQPMAGLFPQIIQDREKRRADTYEKKLSDALYRRTWRNPKAPEQTTGKLETEGVSRPLKFHQDIA